MRLIDADRLLTERMKSMYYHLPNGDIAIPIIDIEHAPTIEPKTKMIAQIIFDEDKMRKIVYEAVECIKEEYDIVDNSDTVSEWIPCSERLPHAEYGESDNVLVTCESKYIRLLYFNGGNWCYPTGEFYEHRIDKVVAWMPLPEPWKGADNE